MGLWGCVSALMAPTKLEAAHDSKLRLTPAKAALSGLSKEEVQRFFYKTHTSSEFIAPADKPDADIHKYCHSENFYDIHMVGQRDSKYMKYQWKRAPLWDRSLCAYTREFQAHSLADGSVVKEAAEFIKSKQGVSRSKAQPPFLGVTKYTDDYKPYTRDEARGACRPSAKPVIQVDDMGRPFHPLTGTGNLEETVSFDHETFGVHPLELAKAEKAVPPKGNLGTQGHLVPQTTAYREEFFHEKGVPRRPLRKPIRCKSAPALRGPVEAVPNWMRDQVASGQSWAASRVIPRPPDADNQQPQPRPRPASAGAVGSRAPSATRVRPPSAGRIRPPSAGRMRPPSVPDKTEGNLGQEKPPSAARRPASAGALRSSS